MKPRHKRFVFIAVGIAGVGLAGFQKAVVQRNSIVSETLRQNLYFCM
jgi:hypothetical protein